MLTRIMNSRLVRMPMPLAVIAVIAMAMVLSKPAMAEGTGAYFSLVNTYLYTKGPLEGGRYLVRPRTAFTVVDQQQDAQDKIWRLIVFHPKDRKVSGEGWTPRAPHELLPTERKPVEIFSRILDGGNKPFDVVLAPVAGLKLLNETIPSKVFSQIVWQKVKYSFHEPIKGWIKDSAGIYRVGKTTAFLTLVYGEMVTGNLDKEKMKRLMSGVVHVGDTFQEVKWALDTPYRTQEEIVGETKRTTWEYPAMVVLFENDVVKQIN